MDAIEGESLRWSAERRAETSRDEPRRKRNDGETVGIYRAREIGDRSDDRTEREEDREPDPTIQK